MSNSSSLMLEVCSLQNAVTATGFCAHELPVPVQRARMIISLGKTDILALERDTESVVLLEDSDGDGFADTSRQIITADNLNHGIALHEGFLYASSDTTVYRWSYEHTNDVMFAQLGPQEVIVNNINADGQGGAPEGHTTRTMVFDSSGRLYISVGSLGNVDPDSYRSRIRRFDMSAGGFPLNFVDGEVFADGLRNEVGLAWDKHGVLWGVENGADRLERSDLGGDIHNDNPAEELNRFRQTDAGKHWGYPYCWTEFLLPGDVGRGKGTAWAWPGFLSDGTISDDECRENYEESIVSMQAHSAPLGIKFYNWQAELPLDCDPSEAFPKDMDGYAFVAYHGSWNRDIPTGYKVGYIPFDAAGDVVGEPVDLLAHEPPNAQWEDGFRPVDVDFDACGRLLVSSDGSSGRGSKIVKVVYQATPTSAPNPLSPTSSSFATDGTLLCALLFPLIVILFCRIQY